MFKKINRVFHRQYFEYLILSIIILLFLFARLYKINNPIADWHSWRQADTSSVSRTYVEQGINILLPRYHDISTIQTGYFNPQGYRFVEFPIYNLIHSLLFLNFPFLNLEVWGRLLSIFSSLISTFFIYLIGRRFIDRWGGLIASFFFSLIPFNIYFSRVILPEPLSVTFALISVWLFVKFIDRGNFSFFYLAAISLSLAILTKPFTLFYSIPMIYLVLRKYGLKSLVKNSKLFIHFFVFSLITILPFLFWRGWMSKFPEGIPFWKWAFNGNKIRFKPSFWRWIFGERVGHLILGSWGLIPFSFGLLKKPKGEYFNHFFFIGSFFYLLIVASANVMHDYYQTIIIPAICLVLAQGVVNFWEQGGYDKKITRILLVFSLMVMFFTGGLQVKEFYKINHPEIIESGIAVDRLTTKDSLIVAPYNGDTALLYQTGRWGWPYVDRPIQELIKNGADYYLSVNYDAQTKEFMEIFETLEETENYIILDLSRVK